MYAAERECILKYPVALNYNLFYVLFTTIYKNCSADTRIFSTAFVKKAEVSI